MEPVVAREVAEAELSRWEEALDVSIAKGIERAGKKSKKDEDDGDDSNAFADAKEAVIDGIMAGFISIETDGTIVLKTPRLQAAYRFEEPTGHAHTCLGKKSEAGFVAFLASISQRSPEQFLKLKQREYRLSQAIGMLFLAPSA